MDELYWTPQAIVHIAGHDISQMECEEAWRSRESIRPGHSGRLICVGRTGAGRWLAIIVEPIPGGDFFPVQPVEKSGAHK